MDDVRKLIDQMVGEVRSNVSSLRQEMRSGFEEQQRNIARQAHVMDEGLAAIDDMFRAHRENLGKVVEAVWGEILQLKSLNVEILRRLSDLEGRNAG